MKNHFCSSAPCSLSLIALVFMLVISCKGPEGPQGPMGTTGATGVAGVQGPTGNANVVYTAWKPVDVSSGFAQTTDNFYTFLDNVRTATSPLLTQDVIDKSVVYTYFKTGQLLYDNANAGYGLVERIQAGDSGGYVKIPGRTTSNFSDFIYYAVNQPNLGVNYLPFNITLYTAYYDSAGKQALIPELAGKTGQFYRDLIKVLPQYRIVIVNGSTAGGRIGAVNYKDYEAVKKAYNLPD